MADYRIENLVVGPVQTNCYFLINEKNNEAIVVDPGDAGKALYGKANEWGLTIKAILLTHGHFDHAGGVKELAELCENVEIIAHEAEKDTLDDPRINLSGMMGRNPETYQVTRFVADEEELEFAGFKFRVLFTPGHTAGGCSYYFPNEMIVFSGDSLFCGSVGRTDFPGGSMSTLVRSVKDKLLSLPDFIKVYPGHDSWTTIGEERVYNAYLS